MKKIELLKTVKELETLSLHDDPHALEEAPHFYDPPIAQSIPFRSAEETNLNISDLTPQF